MYTPFLISNVAVYKMHEQNSGFKVDAAIDCSFTNILLTPTHTNECQKLYVYLRLLNIV